MNPHLFVYGSLLTTAGHAQGTRLRQEAVLLGPATVQGRLFRVTWYPALRPAVNPADRVHGELYRLADVERSLAWLDEYEGLTPSQSSAAAGGEYLRLEKPVRLNDGSTLLAWLYEHQRALPAAARVPDGIWRG